MKTTIDLAHQSFFKNNGYIQFEELLSKEQIEQINTAVLAEKSGRDIWRSSPTFNKILNQRTLAGIASELVQYKPLRLGYDQYLTPPVPFPATASLNEVSCLQGILCGALICLNDAETLNPLYPTKAGDATYINATFAFPWGEMGSDQRFLLITYAEERALYIFQENDPHKHDLKQFGYSFGDRLKDQWHPIVYR